LPSSVAPEKAFYEILEDLKEYLSDLTLVGGWLPLVYARHLWGLSIGNIVTTADVDFGVSGALSSKHRITVYDTLSALKYNERHIKLGHLLPVVFYRGGKIPVEFIADREADAEAIARALGTEVHINRIDGFEFLLQQRIPVTIKRGPRKIAVYCPRPAAFLYNKLSTFSHRETDDKKAKDLVYAYFVLRFAPDITEVFRQIRAYKDRHIFPAIESELPPFFKSLTSQGPLWIERENGPDEFVEDVREDAFERFQELLRNVYGKSSGTHEV